MPCSLAEQSPSTWRKPSGRHLEAPEVGGSFWVCGTGPQMVVMVCGHGFPASVPACLFSAVTGAEARLQKDEKGGGRVELVPWEHAGKR